MDEKVRRQIKATAAKLVGVIKGRIQKELREMSDSDLIGLSLDMSRRTEALARLDSPYKVPPYGLRFRLWRHHPMRPYITEEILLREAEKERSNPRAYWGPLYDLSSEELDDYNKWLQESARDHLWRMTTEDRLTLWRKDRGHFNAGRGKRNPGRTLPSLPKKAQREGDHSSKEEANLDSSFPGIERDSEH